MTQILDGKVIKTEISKNAAGGTELVIDRMIKYIPEESFKGWQIIHSRIPDSLSPDHKKMLVFHDLPNDPMYSKLADKEFQNQFDKFVFVSNWQQQYFHLMHGIPYSKSTVIRNMIDPFPIRKDFPTKKINIIYHTTPHRGLEILIPVFIKLQEVFKNKINLDVYSSFEIYGWRERDEKYKDLFEVAKRTPGINYYGFQSNEVIREKLKDSHIFAYPCIWPETSCLAAIEAMAAGCFVVHPNYGALSETCAYMGLSYPWSEDRNDHAQKFYNHMRYLINTLFDIKSVENVAQQHIINSAYNCNDISKIWINTLAE